MFVYKCNFYGVFSKFFLGLLFKYFVFIYKAQEIDECSFACLNEELIRTVIPKAGPRALFLKKYEENKENSNVRKIWLT